MQPLKLSLAAFDFLSRGRGVAALPKINTCLVRALFTFLSGLAKHR